MIRKLKDKMSFVINSFNSYKFKGIFLILIINSFYGVMDIANQTGFFYGIYSIYNSSWFNAILLLCLFVNTLNICDLYKKNYSVIIRHKSKKSYIAEMSIIIFITNGIVILLSFMMSCIPLFFKYIGDFSINMSINGINILIYFIYHFCRFILISSVLSLILYYLWNLIHPLFSFILACLIALSLVIYPISFEIATHFKFFFGYYLLNPRFENITLDIYYSLLLILILVTIATILYQVISALRRDMG